MARYEKRGSGSDVHRYNKDAVNKAIKNNRTGKIGGKEARLIHALLKGRTR